MMIVSALASMVLWLQAAPELPSASDASPEAEELVCKTQTGTGTRFKKKTCMTRAQWEALAEQNKRDYAASRDRPTIETRRER